MSTSGVDRKDVMNKLIAASKAASEIVMRIYAEADPGVVMKGPNDPVTRADKEANALLLELLGRDFPGVPLVAEESDPATYADFGKAPHALFIDPVDGTREFIAKNGEFAIMLGFAEGGVATVGVVDACAFGEMYVGVVGHGAFMIEHGDWTPLHVGTQADLSKASCAVSRSHRSAHVDAQLAKLGLAKLVPTGGAGIKAVRVATGSVDLYAHPSQNKVKLWDTCAPEALVHAAGGVYTDAHGKRFDYRGPYAQNEGTVAGNPALHAEAIKRLVG